MNPVIAAPIRKQPNQELIMTWQGPGYA